MRKMSIKRARSNIFLLEKTLKIQLHFALFIFIIFIETYHILCMYDKGLWEAINVLIVHFAVCVYFITGVLNLMKFKKLILLKKKRRNIFSIAVEFFFVHLSTYWRRSNQGLKLVKGCQTLNMVIEVSSLRSSKDYKCPRSS